MQRLAAAAQTAGQEKLAGVATRSLEAVFGRNTYRFAIELEQKRNRTEARLCLYDRRGNLLGDPLESTGHGYVDVAAFALRMAAMVMARPRVRRLFVADEPFRAVDRSKRGRVRSLVESLAAELGVQVLLVTHDPELVTGGVIDLGE